MAEPVVLRASNASGRLALFMLSLAGGGAERIVLNVAAGFVDYTGGQFVKV